jgi:hypothetical protein
VRLNMCISRLLEYIDVIHCVKHNICVSPSFVATMINTSFTAQMKLLILLYICSSFAPLWR